MIKFGIIGCGIIARAHGRAVINAKDGELYAVCDIIEGKADKFAQEYGAKKIYYDYKKLLKDKEIDAVCICTPSGIHGEMVIDAVKAGKHVLCEKPLEITTKKIDRMVEECKKHDVKVACVFQKRKQPMFAEVKRALDNNELGKIILADTYLKYYRSPEYYKSAGWRATWELDGGGALMNQGVHGVDLMSWFMGGIQSVQSIVKTQLHDIKVEDTAISLVKYKNGAIGVIEGTTSVLPAQQSRFEIHGEKGSIIVDDSGIKQWFVDGAEIEKNISKAETSGAQSDPKAIGLLSHLSMVEDLIDSIKSNKKPFVTPEEGREAVDAILAIYKSSAEGREIKL